MTQKIPKVDSKKAVPRAEGDGRRGEAAVKFTRALRDLLIAEGNKKKTVRNPETGEPVTLSKMEWVVIAAYNEAVKGDAAAREWISKWMGDEATEVEERARMLSRLCQKQVGSRK